MRYLKLLIVAIFLFGCTQKKLEKEIIYIFYAPGCHACEELKSNLGKKLEVEYELIFCDMDLEENVILYKDKTANLENFPKESATLPLIVYENHFATAGYNPYLDDLYVEIFKRAKNNESVLSYLDGGIWEYEQYSNK